jgi:hypothetical protein
MAALTRGHDRQSALLERYRWTPVGGHGHAMLVGRLQGVDDAHDLVEVPAQVERE